MPRVLHYAARELVCELRRPEPVTVRPVFLHSPCEDPFSGNRKLGPAVYADSLGNWHTGEKLRECRGVHCFGFGALVRFGIVPLNVRIQVRPDLQRTPK